MLGKDFIEWNRLAKIPNKEKTTQDWESLKKLERQFKKEYYSPGEKKWIQSTLEI